MMWWLLAAGAAFYLLFHHTVPKASEVFKPAGTGGEIDVPVQPGKQRAGTKPTTVADFAGANAAKNYDPSKNPFRAPAAAPAGDGFAGSFGDIIPEDSAPDEVPADEDIPAEDGGDADGLDEAGNGQY